MSILCRPHRLLLAGGLCLKVLFVSAEVAPFAKVGGLADVASSLPKALARLGQDVRVLMPAYQMVVASRHPRMLKRGFKVPMNLVEQATGSLLGFEAEGNRLWLLGGEDRFEQCTRSDLIYTPGRDSYLFFAKAALTACEQMDWIPDVIHCNDWHTGFLPVLLREQGGERWNNTASIFTIHNLAYQGEFGRDTLGKVGLPEGLYNSNQLETYGMVNFLKAGCVFSDFVNTVSPSYSKEIQTSEFGFRLEGLMKYLAQEDRLAGILNGIDTEVFDPGVDPTIAARYSFADLSGKAKCKSSLLKELGFDGEGMPLVGMVTRLSDQKGFDLIIDCAERFLALPINLIVQGLGDQSVALKLRQIELSQKRSVGGKLRFVEEFDPQLAQRIYSGSDMFLMPSAFEPCGLGQMIAMRYGSVPIVRKTGGLADTVFEGTSGFVFEKRSSDDLFRAVSRAVEAFGGKRWQELVVRCMKIDHSWTKSARLYEEMYMKAKSQRAHRAHGERKLCGATL